METLSDWNVIVTVHAGGYGRVRRLLRDFGSVARTDYFNVLVMRVDDPWLFMDALQARVDDDPFLLKDLARVVPLEETFLFQSREDFEEQVRRTAQRWLPALADTGFHVRMHRRGFKGRLSSQEEERMLDGALLEALAARGTPASISFEDPDAIIAVETVGQHAGLSLLTREALQRYTLLGID